MKKESDPLNLGKRPSIIEAIKTPLNFFVLAILVVEALILGIAIATGNYDKEVLTYGALGILFLSVLVGAAAIWKPEALSGKRYTDFDESFAEKLGEDIYTALDPYLANLGETERMGAYELLRETLISNSSSKSRTLKRFCSTLSGTIIRRADLQNKWRKTRK